MQCLRILELPEPTDIRGGSDPQHTVDVCTFIALPPSFQIPCGNKVNHVHKYVQDYSLMTERN